MAALMAIAIMTLPTSIWTFALIFVLGGTNVALEETEEDSFCAELVREEHHGMAFGLLATVNGIGDFLSSVIVGLLWTAFGTTNRLWLQRDFVCGRSCCDCANPDFNNALACNLKGT